MIYPYVVGYNGKWYPAGTEVPEETAPVENKSVGLTEGAAKIPDDDPLTKTDINRMPVAQLKELCEKEGIDTVEMSGAEMKKLLIEKYQL